MLITLILCSLPSLIVGVVFGVWYQHRVSLRTRDRRGNWTTVEMRDEDASTRFAAFRDMYQNYSDPWECHYLTEEDIEDTRTVIRRKISARFSNQDLLYQQAGIDLDEVIETLSEKAITDAKALFLAI